MIPPVQLERWKIQSCRYLDPHFQQGFDFISFFSNQTLEISIKIPYETSNVIQ